MRIGPRCGQYDSPCLWRDTESGLTRRLFIHATNVHQGGGLTLLNALLAVLPEGMQTVLSLHERVVLSVELSQGRVVRRAPPTIVGRFMAEMWLRRSVGKGDIVLSFGNLPPLFKNRGYAVVFVQNRYLVNDVELDSTSFKTWFRLFFERLWLHSRITNADLLIVQTPSMKRALEALTRNRVLVSTLPFVADPEGYVRQAVPVSLREKKETDFIYVASGDRHKNHRRLIEAWCLLAAEGFYPSLTLTLDSGNFVELCGWVMRKTKEHGLRINNVSVIAHDKIGELYSRAGALIYASTMESFGLPLIEARQAGLPILASELDYVRDVVDPEQTFDPESPISIARAVRRFMGWEAPAAKLQDARTFLDHVLKSAENNQD